MKYEDTWASIADIRRFYKVNPEFLGNRERSILESDDAKREVWEGHKDCYKVISGDQSFVIAWSMKNRKRGTIVN